MAAASGQLTLEGAMLTLGIDGGIVSEVVKQVGTMKDLDKHEHYQAYVNYVSTLANTHQPPAADDIDGQLAYVENHITLRLLHLNVSQKEVFKMTAQVQQIQSTLTNIEDRVTNLVEKDELATTQAKTIERLTAENAHLHQENRELCEIIAGYRRKDMTEKNDADLRVTDLEYQIRLVQTQSDVFARALAESQRLLADKDASYRHLGRQYQETQAQERDLSQKFQELRVKHAALNNQIATGVLVGDILDQQPRRNPEPELQLESKVDDDIWTCTSCTFKNVSGIWCAICTEPRKQ
jgi:DNA repair exonuclease SbcCD ATPase subunit